MYEERRNFGLRDVIIQILFVVLFIFILIWLFPTKGYLKNNTVTKDELKDSLQVLYGQAFANNIDSMREAATGYFTSERLPKNVGDSVTLTLGEMLDKRLVLPFKDSNNQACDSEKSFVTLTKMDNEYQMKVQLSCSDYSDYIISYIGCYGYCDKDLCQQQTTKPVANQTTNNNPKPVSTTYTYEYRKTWQNEWSDWSDWSEWSTTKTASNSNTRVEIKTEPVFDGYNQVYSIIGYKDVTVYETQTVGGGSVGTYTDVIDATKSTSGSGHYTDWAYQGYVTSQYALSTAVGENSTIKYEYVSDKTTVDCSNVCKNVTTYTYKKYTRSYVSGGTNYTCPSGYTLSGTKCSKTYTVNSTAQTVQVPVTKSEPIYGYVNGSARYKNVTYYRYMTRTLVKEAGSDTKWSQSSNDTNLLNNGYVKTGNYKEVK